MNPTLAGAAFLAASALIILWDVLLAGRIARVRSTPRPFSALTALAGLLIAPAALVAVASSSILTGRSIHVLDWVWPATLVLYAGQAAYTAARHLVTPLISLPILLYNVMLVATALVRLSVFRGEEPAGPLLALTAAQSIVVSALVGPGAMTSPLFLQVPLLSPAFPARYRMSRAVRGGFALLAALAVALTAIELPKGYSAVLAYDRYQTVRLTERTEGDFSVGLRVFPVLHDGPAPLALKSDLDLVDTLQVEAIAVHIAPEAARGVALDSIARSLEQARRDSVPLFVTLAYPRDAARRFARSPRAYTQQRLEDVRRIARRLSPTYLIPAHEPYGAGARIFGDLPLDYWREYLSSAAAVTHRVSRRIKVGYAASSFTREDSALYAWAATPASGMDVVGFALFPTAQGALGLEAKLYAADRWMRINRPTKEHWVFAAGGFPMSHGERNQERAVWAVLAWATSRPLVKGVIVDGAGDYERMTGLRAPGGRLRRAVLAVGRALRGLRESTTI